MKAAELFVRCLENEGVEYIFGVPGEENVHFLMALKDSAIRFILCRHEQGAAFMADAYGRLTGKAGVCLGTLGPGATNLVTGVANANLDRSPLVVITAQADSTRQHKESHQTMDVVGMFRPITKWAQPIRHPHNIPEVVRKAFQLAQEQKTGACHIELANDIAALEVSNRPIPVHAPKPPVADAETINEALFMIRRAQKPIILAGNGVIRGRAAPALREFTEKTEIGVVSTFMGKGAVPRKSPYCLFTIGLQTRDYTWDAVNNADLVITLGYDLIEYPPVIWNQCDRPVKIIHMDFLSAEADDYYRVDLEVVGDLRHTLEMINKSLAENISPEFDLSYQKKLRLKMQEDLRQYKDDDTRGLVRPQKIIWDVREVMGEKDILLSDVGAHKMWTARYYHCDRPNTCLIPNGFCSMGFALPAAIGAQMVCPGRKVLAICGDGGFLMNLQELETAVRLGLKPVIMIWEDKGYGLIKWKQEIHFHKHTKVNFNNPDFVRLAESFGCQGLRVENAVDLKPALEKAFQAGCPALLAVQVDYRENLLLTERLGRIQCAV